MSHAREHAELLEHALSGALDPADSRLRERLRDCAECAEEWKAMNELVDALDSTRRELPLDLQAALRDGPAPGAERVLSTLRAAAAGRGLHAPSPAPAPARNVTRRPWRLAIAALLVAALCGWALRALLTAPDRERDPTLLGPEEFALLEPRGSVRHVERFAWRHTLAPQGWYELRIEGFDEASGTWKTIEHGAGRLHADSWSVPGELDTRWPERLRWRVIAREPSSDPLASDWVEFRLQR